MGQAAELLLSTILEAALRTWEEIPFVLGDRTFNRKVSLERFREEYFSEEWKESCDLALRSHTNLRHRNAHPDWLTGHGGSLSHEKMTGPLTTWFACAGFMDI